MSRIKYKPSTFVLVPSKHRLAEVDAVAQSVFLWLCDHMNRDTGTCFPSIATLAELCHKSKSTIKDRIGHLEKAGLITKKARFGKDGRNTSNLYQVLIDDHIPLKRGRSNTDPYGSTIGRAPGEQLATNQTHIEPKSLNQRESALRALPPKEFAREFFTKGSSLPMRMIDTVCREAGVPQEVAEAEMPKFLSYWTEPNSDGTQMRWQLHKTFGVKKRFMGWLGKAEPRGSRSGAGVTI